MFTLNVQRASDRSDLKAKLSAVSHELPQLIVIPVLERGGTIISVLQMRLLKK